MISSSTSKILSGIAALSAATLFFFGCFCLKPLSSFISSMKNPNLPVYAGTVILFCLCFLLFQTVFNRMSFAGHILNNPRFLRAAAILFTVGNLGFLFLTFLYEGRVIGGVSDKYIWHNLPVPLVVALLLIENIVFFQLLKNSSIDVANFICLLLYAGLVLLIGYTFYTPDIFGRGLQGDASHGHAYYNSIYNVFQGSAYTEFTTSIYGHYALFFKPFLKLLGGSFHDYIVLIALLGAFCYLCMFLAMHLLVKQPVIRILGAIAMSFPILSMRGGYYWQAWPHRILFMSIMLLYGAICSHFRKWNKLTCFLGYFIAFWGIIWNTETGIVCAVAWCGLWILRKLSQKQTKASSVLLAIMIHGISVILCFCAAFETVNIYNHLAGAPSNTLREFLFPLISSTYMTDVLRLDLPLYPCAYMLVTALFLTGTAWGISCIKSEFAAYPCYCFFLAVLGLGQLTYFINRPAYHNLDVCHLPAVLLLCIFAETGFTSLKSSGGRWSSLTAASKAVSAGMSLAVLLTLTTGTLLQYAYNADIKKAFHNEDKLAEFTSEIAASVPKDTYAFGISVPEIYAMLGWDTNCYTLDFTDISVRPYVADWMLQDMRSKDVPEVFTSANSIKHLEKYSSDRNTWFSENYLLEKEFTYKGFTFQYYTKQSV